MKTIVLTDEQYDLLLDELRSLHCYHWNDDQIIESSAYESDCRPSVYEGDDCTSKRFALGLYDDF